MSSKVVSARLHPDNRDERQALEILERLRKQGYQKRYIIMAGILALGGVEIPPPASDGQAINDLQDLIADLRDIIENASFTPGEPGRKEPHSDVPPALVASLTKLVKRHAADE